MTYWSDVPPATKDDNASRNAILRHLEEAIATSKSHNPTLRRGVTRPLPRSATGEPAFMPSLSDYNKRPSTRPRLARPNETQTQKRTVAEAIVVSPWKCLSKSSS